MKILIIAAPEICADDFLGRIERLCEAGADEILLRAKELDEAKFYDLAVKVCDICSEFKCEFIVNHFFDAAVKLSASFWLTSAQLAGLAKELGCGENLEYEQAKISSGASKSRNFSLAELLNFKKLNPDTKIYAPAHDLAQAKISSKIADILVASHIFKTGCKAEEEPKGERLISSLKCVNFNGKNPKIYALGGINEQNFPLAVNAGADGICLMSSAMRCENEQKFLANFIK